MSRPYMSRRGAMTAAGALLLAASAGITAGGPVFAPVSPNLITVPTAMRTNTAPPFAVTSGKRRRAERRAQRQVMGTSPHKSLRRAIEARVGRLSGRQWNRLRRYLQRASVLGPSAMKVTHWRTEDLHVLSQALIARRCQPTMRVSATGEFLVATSFRGVALLPTVGPNPVNLVLWDELVKVFA